MLSTFKKIFVSVLLFAAACACGEPISLFDKTSIAEAFFTPEQILKAYVGKWSGRQVVRVGENSATGRIEVTYTVDADSPDLRLIGVGRITSDSGDSVPTTSYMYIENGQAILQMRNEQGQSFYYKGYPQMSSVIWMPIYDFFLFDFQQDYFYSENGKRFMTADGKRNLEYRGKWIMVSIFSSFEYVRQTYPIGSVKSSIKRDVKPKIESGVQFGD